MVRVLARARSRNASFIPRAEGGEGPLEFGTDVNAMRFVDGEREDASAEALDAATAANLTAEGCTLQVGL